MTCAEIAPTLNAHFGTKQGLEDQHINGGAGLFVTTRPVFATDGQANAAFSEDVALALNATNEQPYVAHSLNGNSGRMQVESTYLPMTFDERNVTSKGNRSRVEPGRECHTLHSSAPAVAPNWQAGGKQTTLGGQATAGAMVKEQIPGIQQGMQVRRLTPRECERLQGFEDDYTLIEYRGKPAADGPRYKALGNSMAVPVVRWIGERIQMVETIKL